MELFFAFSGSSTATSTSEQEPALAKRKSATGSLYDATRSQARHSATTACSSSATALLTVSNIRCLPLCTPRCSPIARRPQRAARARAPLSVGLLVRYIERCAEPSLDQVAQIVHRARCACPTVVVPARRPADSPKRTDRTEEIFARWNRGHAQELSAA